MKFSAALSLAIAPVALAKAVHNVYPVRRDKHQKQNAEAAQALPAGLAGVGITQNAVTEVIIIWANPGAGAATTTINQQVTVTQTVTAGGAAATQGTGTTAQGATSVVAGTGATHSVTVGGSAGLQFTPPELKAAVGDMVIFTFESNNHTATQSAFATPCDPLAGGMDSGFQANPNNTVSPPPQVAMQVMVDTPLWFYCKQAGHCGKGMTFSINPTAEKTQAMFQQMAIAQKGQGAGSAITGNSTSAAPAAANPAATSTAASAATSVATGSIVQGTGQAAAGGACVCAVSCGSGAFPAVQAQGVGAFGGFPGSLPMAMLEA